MIIARLVQADNYDSIRQTYGRSLSNDIPLERAWQIEFYKSAYRFTPRKYITSVDVGALFGSSGFIDLTIHGDGVFCGTELVREASKLTEYIQRFAPGGRYSLLNFSDYCLIDFGRVTSMDALPMDRIAADMSHCNKLFVLCYDTRVKNVIVYNSAMDVVYQSRPKRKLHNNNKDYMMPRKRS